MPDPFRSKLKDKKQNNKADRKLIALKKSIKVVFMAINPEMSFDQFLKHYNLITGTSQRSKNPQDIERAMKLWHK